jgi:uncharacterized protein YggU (UPF0235/DUF167 family)
MNDRKFRITDSRGGAALNIRVVTQAEQTEIAGITEDGETRIVKVRLMASSAGDPAANAELISYLAARLGIASEQVEVVLGETGRDKIVSIYGMTAEQIQSVLFDGGA